MSEQQQRITVRPEQLLVAAWMPTARRWALGEDIWERLPWASLGAAHLYVSDGVDLNHALRDALDQGYQVLGGYDSDRRGLRSVIIGVGAWGWRGQITVRPLDAWALEGSSTPLEGQIEATVTELQGALRALCLRLNEEPTPFRASAGRWLGALYSRLGAPVEPDGYAQPLPLAAASLARMAHVAGPIVHCRTTLEPFTSLDLERAYGNAMLADLPVGAPIAIPLSGARGKASLERWTAWDLQRATGIAEATVEISEGPLAPLIPLLRPAESYERSLILYPTGRIRGAFVLAELADLEQSGAGRVEQLHRGYVFQAAPVLAPVVRYLRQIAPSLPPQLSAKRLEHILYGRCARGLTLSCLGSAPSFRKISSRDLVPDRSARRVEGSPEIRPVPVPGLGAKTAHPVWRARAQLQPAAEWGTMDRPDRSAMIVARSRIAVTRLIRSVDQALGSSRPGAAIGRVYVDGIEVEARPDQLPAFPGVAVRRHGSRLDIFRASASAARLDDGSIEYEAAGLYHRGSFQGSVEEFVAELRAVADPSGGPCAGGRIWPPHEGGDDPRLYPHVTSEPLCLTPAVGAAMGFGAGAAHDG